ncbi:MAG TPA: DUF4382 domain-containing protein [Chitinophagaceae bacterium]|nr:DUF4382 domain-containing protein [Chitinophagaceae bacterium]
MKAIRVFSQALLFTLATLALFSCNKDKNKSRLTVYLTDAPAAYDAVNIEIVGMEIKATTGDDENGWQELPVNAGIYNLLEFTNGMDTILSSVELPAGKVSQLRLILGNDNSIVINGTSLPLPLQTPSAQTSGLKFNIHADLVEGVEYKMWIDFDCARSVVVTGNNNYILKPVLRTFTEATSGAIKGNVQPAAAQAVIYAINAALDSLSAIPDPVTGDYLVRGVPAGTWNISADGNNGYMDQIVNNISVSLGQVTTVDTITLVQ